MRRMSSRRSAAKGNRPVGKPASMYESITRSIEHHKSINEELLLHFLGKPEAPRQDDTTRTCMPIKWHLCKERQLPDGERTHEAQHSPLITCVTRVPKEEKEDVLKASDARTEPEALDQKHRRKIQERRRSISNDSYSPDWERTVPMHQVVGSRMAQGMQQILPGQVYLVNIPKLAESRLLALLDFLDGDDDFELETNQSMGSYGTWESFDLTSTGEQSSQADSWIPLTQNSPFWRSHSRVETARHETTRKRRGV